MSREERAEALFRFGEPCRMNDETEKDTISIKRLLEKVSEKEEELVILWTLLNNLGVYKKWKK